MAAAPCIELGGALFVLLPTNWHWFVVDDVDNHCVLGEHMYLLAHRDSCSRRGCGPTDVLARCGMFVLVSNLYQRFLRAVASSRHNADELMRLQFGRKFGQRSF